MPEITAIAGVSTATVALIISIICLVWILIHVKTREGFGLTKPSSWVNGGVY